MVAGARFISVEGGEGVGKSTQIVLLADWLRKQGHEVVLTREPGGTAGAEAIRDLLLSGAGDRWGPKAEALLFAAARSDHVEKHIRPALAAGKWVLSDRFIDSSRAYQGVAGGIGDAHILNLHRFGTDDFFPDLTIFLSFDPASHQGENGVHAHRQGVARALERDGGKVDRIGARDQAYHDKVEQAFVDFCTGDAQRIKQVDANGSEADVHQRIIALIPPLLA